MTTIKFKLTPVEIEGYALTERTLSNNYASVQARCTQTSNCKLYKDTSGMMYLIHNCYQDQPFRVIGIYPTKGMAERRKNRHIRHLKDMGITYLSQKELSELG